MNDTETYEVLIWLENGSQPIIYDAVTCYIKEAYTCVVFYNREGELRLHKYPTSKVMRIEEEYRYIPRKSTRG